MSIQEAVAEIKSLSTEKKVAIIQDLWDSILPNDINISLSNAQKALLDERLAGHKANPEEVQDWPTMRKEITDEIQGRFKKRS